MKSLAMTQRTRVLVVDDNRDMVDSLPSLKRVTG